MFSLNRPKTVRAATAPFQKVADNLKHVISHHLHRKKQARHELTTAQNHFIQVETRKAGEIAAAESQVAAAERLLKQLDTFLADTAKTD